MTQSITLTKQHKRLFNALMNEDPDEEAVAVLFGTPEEDSERWVIEPLFNEAPEPERDRRCEVTVEQLKPIIEKQRAQGRVLKAWWHSHPTTAAVPSDLDRGNTHGPSLVLISSNAVLKYESQRHRAWWIEEGQEVEEVTVG